METREWNLLNAAQRLIPRLSAAQKVTMQTSVESPNHDGEIISDNIATAKALCRMDLIERASYLSPPTPLGQMVRNILTGRRAASLQRSEGI